MRGKKRVSNISEFQSGVDLRMKRPGFRVPGSVVRITLQDFMTYRHEQYGSEIYSHFILAHFFWAPGYTVS